MKEWKPDQEFESADFPVPPKDGAAPKKPAARQKPKAPVPPPAGPVAWTPDTQFERADVPTVPPGMGQPRDRTDSLTPGARKTRPARSEPEPPPLPDPNDPNAILKSLFLEKKEEIDPKAELRKRLQREHAPDAFTPEYTAPVFPGAKRIDPRDRPKVVRRSRVADRDVDPGAGDFGARLLARLVLTKPESARNIIRHWYWQKPGQGEGALKSVHPHDRIFILLATIGKKVTTALFEVMSPMEREQLIGILKEPRQPTPIEISIVRRAFGELMRHDG